MRMRIIVVGVTVVLFLLSVAGYSQTEQAKRPTLKSNRWQEDWSVLANPKVPHEMLDSLKYIPLSAYDPQTYLSLGMNVRERYELNNAVAFGIGPMAVPQSYVISRLEAHADLRIANQVQIFMQLQNDNAPGKTIITPVDKDRLDLEMAFIALVEPVAQGTLKLRAGRQQMAFDMQRFISVRDGPNVRQSYDALWGDYEIGKWRFIAFASHPVQAQDKRCFDDYSSRALTYGGFRIERKIADFGKLSSYLSRYTNDNAVFPSAAGSERRNILDMRFVGKMNSFDFDLEMMGQLGNIANKSIRAWGLGSVSGYTFSNISWQPRLGLQLDAASGSKSQNSHVLGTFNPLFPNGIYINLSGYTGYTNFIHLKPSLTLKPYPSLSTLFAVAAQWRQSIGDAVYTQPYTPILPTIGYGGRYTGNYLQTRIDWQMTTHIHNALEFVHFNVANALRKLHGHNSNYLGVETKFSW